MNEQLNNQEGNEPALEPIFKLIVVEQVTERVWYEAPGAASATEAVTLYQAGEALETGRKHLSTDQVEVEEVYQESDTWRPIEPPAAPRLEGRLRTTQVKPPTLSEFAKRVAYLVTDLNGFISRIVNEEMTVADFNDSLTGLFNQLAQTEAAVSELVEVFYGQPQGKE